MRRAAFEGNTELLLQQLRQWPKDRWKDKDPQGNTVSGLSRLYAWQCLRSHPFVEPWNGTSILRRHRFSMWQFSESSEPPWKR